MVVVSGLGGGMSQASATGVYTGPWAVERQTLQIQFHRDPNSMIFLSKTGAALSGTTIRSYSIGSTDLTAQVYWYVSKELVHGNFATSSEEIKQKFSSYPYMLDYNNQTSFGPPSAGILGPNSTIQTSCAYYSRRPWNYSTDVEFSNQGVGYNYVAGVYYFGELPDGTYGTKVRGMWSSQAELLYSRGRYGIDKLNPDTYMGVASMYTLGLTWWEDSQADKIRVGAPLYELQGPYNPNQEDPTYVPVLIDLIGNRITNRELISGTYNNSDITGDTASIQIGSGCYTGSNYYDINRHDYT